MRKLPLLLLYACVAFAQKNSGIISGMVRNATSGIPIEGVYVSLIGESAPAVQTDVRGEFRFASLADGSYSLQVEAPEYTEVKPLRISAGADPVTIDLYPLARIEGKVVDEDGKPVHGASVSVWFPLLTGTNRAIRTATSEKDGRFALDKIPAMDYQIHVQIPPPTRRGGYPAVEYYPGVVDFHQAGSIHIAEGVQLAGLEIRLRRVPMTTLKVRVEDLAREGSAAPVEVALDTEPGNMSGRYVRHALGRDGRFHFDSVPAGRHLLQVYRGTGSDDLPYTASVEPSDDEVVVRVPPFVDLQGRVRSTVKPPWDGVLGIGLGMEGAWRRIVVPDEDGSFTLTDVPPGQYTLRLESNNLQAEGRTLRISSARFGEASVLGKPMTVSEGGNPSIEIWLSDENGGIAGSVEDANQSGGSVVVTAQSLDELSGTQANFTEAGPDGSFLFSGLLPGSYRVIAWSLAPSRQGITGSPCSDAAATVTVTNGRTATVKLKRCVQ